MYDAHTTTYLDSPQTVVVIKYMQIATEQVSIYIGKTPEEAVELLNLHPNHEYKLEFYENVRNYTIGSHGQLAINGH